MRRTHTVAFQPSDRLRQHFWLMPASCRRDPKGGWNGIDGRPAAVKNFAAQSLVRLGTDHIDIYLAQRPGATASQLAIAWALAQHDGIVPLVGSRTQVSCAKRSAR